jgi:hypothetical protein
MKKTVPVMAAALLTTGCGEGADPQPATEASEKESIFDPMTEQIEKAKKVDAQALQHKDDIDEALEDADR